MPVMEVDLHKLKINDPFLGQYQQLVRDVVIPYQWGERTKLKGLSASLTVTLRIHWTTAIYMADAALTW